MKKIVNLCSYCNRETNIDGGVIPCSSCIRLLKKSLEEQTTFNDFSKLGIILKIPRTIGSTAAIANGELKFVFHYIKRFVKKSV